MTKQVPNHGNRKLSESGGAPARPAGEVSEEFVTEMFEYDGGRQVTVYVPPDPPGAIVFAGDGQGTSKWGRLIEKAGVPSTMIAGVHGLTDQTLRLREYSPGFEPERFAAHEKFFVEDVRRWTESRFGVVLPGERTAVFGVSAGGELALALVGIHLMSTVRSCAPRLAEVTSRLVLCRVRFRAHTLSLARTSRSSSRTRRGGRTRCKLQMR